MLLPLSHCSSPQEPRFTADASWSQPVLAGPNWSQPVPAGVGTHCSCSPFPSIPGITATLTLLSESDHAICLVPHPSEEKPKSSVMAFPHLYLPHLISNTTHLGQLLALFCDYTTHVPAPGPLHWLFSLGTSPPQVLQFFRRVLLQTAFLPSRPPC